MLAAAGLQPRNSAVNVLMRSSLCWSLFWRRKENYGALTSLVVLLIFPPMYGNLGDCPCAENDPWIVCLES